MLALPILTADGAELDGMALGLVSVEVTREANRIPAARIVLEVPDPARVPPRALAEAELVPGVRIGIKVREGDRLHALFDGVVVSVSMTVEAGLARLVADCRDKAIRLTAPRRTLIYAEGTDADAIGTLLRRNQLQAGDLGSGGPTHEALVQYHTTDWDFIVSRAEALGLAVVVTDGEVALLPPALDGAPALEVQLGVTPLFEAELVLDGMRLPADVAAVGWDLGEGAVTAEATAEALALQQGVADPATMAGQLGLEAERLQHLAPLTAEELAAWASARLARSRLALFRGRLSVPGMATLAPLALVRLAGFSDQFDGVALISGVRHVVEEGGWTSDLTLGLPATTLAERVADVAPPPAGGLLPPARGLTIGLVADYADDPAGEARVRLKLPSVSGSEDLVWARLATPEAGHERGFVFRPEPGDEVVVGFIGDDPRHPVVLGALFGARNPLPPDFAELSADNVGKGIATSNGGALVFQDQDSPILTLKTPGMSLVLDEDAGTITLTDGDATLEMAASGVTLKSGGDLTIEATGKLVLKGATIDAN